MIAVAIVADPARPVHDRRTGIQRGAVRADLPDMRLRPLVLVAAVLAAGCGEASQPRERLASHVPCCRSEHVGVVLSTQSFIALGRRWCALRPGDPREAVVDAFDLQSEIIFGKFPRSSARVQRFSVAFTGRHAVWDSRTRYVLGLEVRYDGRDRIRALSESPLRCPRTSAVEVPV